MRHEPKTPVSSEPEPVSDGSSDFLVERPRERQKRAGVLLDVGVMTLRERIVLNVVPGRAAGFPGSGSGSSAGADLRKLGFTLVEIMVVVIVLAILAATIIPQFTTTTHDARVGTAKATISRLENALERFFIHMDRYPTTSEGLQVLVSPPSSTTDADRWRGPYVKELVPDPWGNPYMYRSPGVHGSTTYDLWSRGADGKDGGEGKGEDITNWRKEAS